MREKLQTKIVTVNPFENIIYNSHGFSDSSKQRVEIGVRSLLEQLMFDQVQVTTRHEFMHAAFITKRNTGIPSLYHNSFSAYGTKNLTPDSKYYSKYMSNEEIYTFSNNAFWASDKFIDIKKYSIESIEHDFGQIKSYLEMNLDVFAQSNTLAREVSDNIENIILNAKGGTIGKIFFFQGAHHKNVLHHSDAQYLLVELGDGRIANVYLDKNKKESFQFAYDVFEKARNPSLIAPTSEELANAKLHYLILLKNIEEDFRKLSNLTEVLDSKNKKTILKFNDLINLHLSNKDLDRDQYNKIMELHYKNFRKDLRNMGSSAREDYSGFMK